MIDYNNETVVSLEEIKKCVSKVIKEHFPFVSKVILFGSYSRGNAKTNSDIDLLVADSPKLKGMNFLAFRTAIMENINKDVDLFRYEDIDKDAEIYKNIMKDGVVVYG